MAKLVLSANKPNLRVPLTEALTERSSSKVTRTLSDNLPNTTASEVQYDPSKCDATSKTKSIQSIGKLKEALSRTSQKLKTYSNPSDIIKPELNNLVATKEILKLRQEIMKLELER